VAERLVGVGVQGVAIEVETCEQIERPPGGKLRMVVAERRAEELVRRDQARDGGSGAEALASNR
jgi:hypothetical protein